MSSESTHSIRLENGNVIGTLWFIGWLFTISFARLAFWQRALALMLWPYYLGVAVG